MKKKTLESLLSDADKATFKNILSSLPENSRALCIGVKEKKKVQQVMQYAEKHKVCYADMKRISEGIKPPVGDDPEFVCNLPEGFRVVFCIEEQPLGWCNHLSVSIDDPTALPSVPAVEEIMHQFGMWGTTLDCQGIWIEEKCHRLNNNEIVDAVSIIQKRK